MTTTRSIDRLPPHSIEAEAGVLGCCLLSPQECLDESVEAIHSTDAFYSLQNREIYETMVAMHNLRVPVDAITLRQWLKDNDMLEKCGGVTYIAQLQDSVPSAANLSYYLSILEEKFLLRRMVKVCTEIVGRIYEYEGNVDGLMDEIERDVLAIRPVKNDFETSKELVDQALQRIEQRIVAPYALTGMTTGLVDLDRLTDGMHAGEMITVAALPSRGKSAVSMNIAVTNALAGVPVIIFTAEMKPAQLMIRSICSESRVNFRVIDDRDIPKITGVAGKLSNAPLYIVQASRWPIGKLMAVARRFKQRFGIRMGVVDYIQLLSGTGDNLEQQVSSISKGIKSICMELSIPVLALSQLNEKSETKYARAIAEDTDSLWKLENDGDWQPDVQKVNLFVEKSRDGATGKVPLTFLKEFTRFESQSRVVETDVPNHE